MGGIGGTDGVGSKGGMVEWGNGSCVRSCCVVLCCAVYFVTPHDTTPPTPPLPSHCQVGQLKPLSAVSSASSSSASKSKPKMTAAHHVGKTKTQAAAHGHADMFPPACPRSGYVAAITSKPAVTTTGNAHGGKRKGYRSCGVRVRRSASFIIIIIKVEVKPQIALALKFLLI
jgi:hypothetical protein